MTTAASPWSTWRTDQVSAHSGDVAGDVRRLVDIAIAGLTAMYRKDSKDFPQTMRGVPGTGGPRLVAEGSSLRYTAMAALGLSRLDEATQREVLAGSTAHELSTTVSARALTDTDPGAVALAAWTAAEVSGEADQRLFDRLATWLGSGEPLPTVDVAWMLTAALAARDLADTAKVQDVAKQRLLEAQGAQGIFPHALPRQSLGRVRAHVGCYADQVYPVQALARSYAVTGDQDAIVAANLCGQRISDLQGPAGQWWWHYDVRNGEVVEGFPVYSVHQHAMGPMALLDLHESGGVDLRGAVALGLRWLDTHPEVVTELVDDRHGVVWRKVGRREPPKAARKLAAVLTAARPGAKVPLVDRLMPPVAVDYECRPYELGWLLYAWLSPQPAANPDANLAALEQGQQATQP